MAEVVDTKRQLLSDGFVLVPGVLSNREVQRLRSEVNRALDTFGINKSGGTVLPNAASEAPGLAWIFSHPRVIEAVRHASDLQTMVFTMEADLHRNYIASAWHKDTGEQVIDTGYFGRDCFLNDECRVIKVALYLQDHDTDKRALHVRSGTIHTPDLESGDPTPVRANAGDMVLFDVRITHRGVQKSMLDRGLFTLGKALSPRHPEAMATRLRRRQMALAGKPARMAVYFAFGAPNENSVRFAQRNMGRQLAQLLKHASPLPESLAQAFEASAIRTVDLS